MRLITREKAKPNNLGERGQALVVAVLAMGVLLGMVAMAVDVGLYLHERRQLQNAADAAALAGALELPQNPSLGIAKARDWAANNGIALETELEDVHVESTFGPNDTMAVTVRRGVGFFFARVLGIESALVRAKAKARVGSPAGLSGLTPWVVTDEVFLGLEPGQEATLKYNARNVFDGNFQPIALDGTGSRVYRDTIERGSRSRVCAQGQESAGCPSIVSTEPGNMVGPTRQAIGWLQDHTSDACDSFEEVFLENEESGTFTLADQCNKFTDPDQVSLVIIVPVIDSLCNGRCDVNVLRFALFFLEGIECGGGGAGQACTVEGRYVRANVSMNALIGPYDPQGSITFVRLVE